MFKQDPNTLSPAHTIHNPIERNVSLTPKTLRHSAASSDYIRIRHCSPRVPFARAISTARAKIRAGRSRHSCRTWPLIFKHRVRQGLHEVETFGSQGLSRTYSVLGKHSDSTGVILDLEPLEP